MLQVRSTNKIVTVLTNILNREETKAERWIQRVRFRCVEFDVLMGNFNAEGLFAQETTSLERDSEQSVYGW